ncbi:MAG: prolipoprotein diacylglyceryl transferase [Planctomycetota bacterium]|jgi:phosphatidylglycerol:prolipoprotein diacylglycerol transferase
MHPELFKLPFTDLTVKSYGLMMVIGFLLAVYVIKCLSRDITPDPQMITNAALYSLIAGVVGARIFFVIHYFGRYKGDLLSVFAIWRGGLELLGGVILAVTVLILYMGYHKLPVRKYLDILAIGLLMALAFGRIGCFLNGCCYGKPTNLPWAVRFPYNSPAHRSQTSPDVKRNRAKPYLELPDTFFTYAGQSDGLWRFVLKPYEDLTDDQKYEVDHGQYRCLPVHPTQLYSSVNALIGCLILYLFWRMSGAMKSSGKVFAKPGLTFALMFIFYGITRFFMEFIRDDNPFEVDGLTVSQNISIGMVIMGVVLMGVFAKIKPTQADVYHANASVENQDGSNEGS